MAVLKYLQRFLIIARLLHNTHCCTSATLPLTHVIIYQLEPYPLYELI
jgi:hypothetical protein